MNELQRLRLELFWTNVKIGLLKSIHGSPMSLGIYLVYCFFVSPYLPHPEDFEWEWFWWKILVNLIILLGINYSVETFRRRRKG